MTENILTIREVADLLKINEKTVYKLVADAKIPGFKVGGSWRFDRAVIAKWIEKGVVPDLAAAEDAPPPANGATLASAYYSPQQATFFAHRLTLEGTGEDAMAQSLST